MNECREFHIVLPHQVRFFMEIMWPVILFIGLVWLRRVNPLYRQHECKQRLLSSMVRGILFINDDK